MGSLDAQIVLSTSWRSDKIAWNALLAAFNEVGIESARVVGCTPDLYGVADAVWPAGTRVAEIREWLTRTECESWLAIDDMELAKHADESLRQHFLLTDMQSGAKHLPA